jgi:hypothetical protein
MVKFGEGHLYSVRGTLPKKVDGDPERRWVKNVDLSVVAPSVDRAIVIAREAHPDITIHDVVHRGGKTIYVDDTLAPVNPEKERRGSP